MAAIIESGVPTNSRVAVGNTATLLVPTSLAPASRRSGFVIQNVGTVDVYVGGAGVTTGTGILLIAQASATTPPATYTNATSGAAYYGIVASGTGQVNVCEEII